MLINETDVSVLPCGCVTDDGGFSRLCDYCGTEWSSAHCAHDASQDQCPECDVAPVAQLAG